MSKRKQTQTKNNKTDTSFLFPHTLHGKKYKKYESFLGFDDKWQSYLEQYLVTKNPDHLIEAIRENNSLLQGRGQNLKYEEYGIQTWESIQGGSQNEPDSIHVNGHTIVWESIHWWQELYNFLGDEEQAKEAKRYLHRIGDALIPPRKERRELSTGDGFVHFFPKIKDEHPSLVYESAQGFIQRWNHVKRAFVETKSQERYRSGANHLIKEDALKAIKKLGDELFEDEVDLLDLSNIRTKTASYIRLVHEFACPICKKEGLSNKTILRLLEKAQKKSKKQNSPIT